MLYSEAIQIPNDEGNLPLLMACAGKAKEELLQKLFEEYPDAAKVKNNDGGLPLHVACEINALIILLYGYFPNTQRLLKIEISKATCQFTTNVAII